MNRACNPVDLRMKISRRGLAGLVIVLTAASLVAELPPSAYEQLQAEAPEVVEIEVQSVRVTKSAKSEGMRTEVRALAAIRKVTRTATGLKPGDTVSLNYSRLEFRVPTPGPGQPVLVKKGERYRAFLERAAKSEAYTIAAGGQSFQRAE